MQKFGEPWKDHLGQRVLACQTDGEREIKRMKKEGT